MDKLSEAQRLIKAAADKYEEGAELVRQAALIEKQGKHMLEEYFAEFGKEKEAEDE